MGTPQAGHQLRGQPGRVSGPSPVGESQLGRDPLGVHTYPNHAVRRGLGHYQVGHLILQAAIGLGLALELLGPLDQALACLARVNSEVGTQGEVGTRIVNHLISTFSYGVRHRPREHITCPDVIC